MKGNGHKKARRITKKETYSFFLCVSLCLFVAISSVPAAVLTIGGDPLAIECDEYGTIGVTRMEQGSAAAQFYSTRAKGSALFLDGTNTLLRFGNGTSTFALWDDEAVGRFTPISHNADGSSIRTLLAAGQTGIRILQTLTYVPGEFEYALRWEISNQTGRAFTDVRLVHGGDASLAGTDFGAGVWDGMSNRVMVVTNSASDDFMALRSTAASAHLEGHFQLVRDACKGGVLPSTANGAQHDAAYALQWNRESLGPGETWTIQAVETWAGSKGAPSAFTNTTILVRHPIFEAWQLNRQTGTYFGTLRLELVQGPFMLATPVWLVIDNNNDRRFMHPTGLTPDGRQYMDVSTEVTAAVGSTLDPGEVARVQNIEVYMRYRTAPPDSIFSLWATE